MCFMKKTRHQSKVETASVRITEEALQIFTFISSVNSCYKNYKLVKIRFVVVIIIIYLTVHIVDKMFV